MIKGVGGKRGPLLNRCTKGYSKGGSLGVKVKPGKEVVTTEYFVGFDLYK